MTLSARSLASRRRTVPSLTPSTLAIRAWEARPSSWRIWIILRSSSFVRGPQRAEIHDSDAPGNWKLHPSLGKCQLSTPRPACLQTLAQVSPLKHREEWGGPAVSGTVPPSNTPAPRALRRYGLEGRRSLRGWKIDPSPGKSAGMERRPRLTLAIGRLAAGPRRRPEQPTQAQCA